MDRRSFLKSVGVPAAGTTIVSSESFASAPAAGGAPPQFLSNGNRNRSNILSNDLSPWSPSTAQPWDVHTINHLYRRAGFGATLKEIATAKGNVYSDVVDKMLLKDSHLTAPTVPALPSYSDDTNKPPSWLHVPPVPTYNNFIVQMMDYSNANMKIRSHWAVQMNQPDTMLREKMSLFWMNHFVVEAKKVYYPQSMYGFLSYFRQNAWGNFKKMVSDVTTMPAMLYYLDGVLNQGASPNENYARELQELFTMGVVDKDGKANYTQADVEAIAQVLTGWTVVDSAPAPNVLPAFYDLNRHHTSLQTKIYDGTPREYNLRAAGVTSATDLFDHMFALDQRGNQIAWYICSKLYQYFVYHDISQKPERDVIDAMAALLISSNWELKPVISALLKSAHFFEEANIGAEIKSPYEHLIGLLRSFDIPIDELGGGTIGYYAFALNQELLDPPNVKGWPGYHNWISTTTLPYRGVIETALVINKDLPAIGVDGYGNNHLDIGLTDTQVTAWGKQFTNYNGKWVDIVPEISSYLCAQPPSKKALDYVNGKFPTNISYEWTLADDTAKVLVLRLLANTIMSLADYQLS